jgi:hypothetical protein
MNTSDIKFNGEIKSFDELFKAAREQFLLYEKLEGIDDWEKYDFSIDCSADQMKFKDMIQIRFIEELTEASMALEDPPEHFWEEIGDALNFFLSAYVMLGVDFKKLPDPQKILTRHEYAIHKIRIIHRDEYSLKVYPIIEDVGSLCNLLKNRPWSQSNFLVSMTDFNQRLEKLWVDFWELFNYMRVSPEEVFEMFWKKYQVNIHRIETGY